MDAETKAIGRVIAVSGAKISGILIGDEENGASAVQIGSMVKIPTAQSTVFGLVTGLDTPDPHPTAPESEKRLIDIRLLGESLVAESNNGAARFHMGVSIYPGLGQKILAATPEDLQLVYARPEAATVQVGRLHQDRSLPAYVVTDELLGKHFAVLGTTGSGKSCAVALILRAILFAHPHGHVVMLDPHNEYANAFDEAAEVLSPATIDLPYWLLNFEETVEVMVGREDEDREAQMAILKEVVEAAKRAYHGEGRDSAHITVDTPVPYRLSGVLRLIDERMGKMDRPGSTLPYLKLKARIEALQADKRFAFMFEGLRVQDTLEDILSRILRIPVSGKPITIVDLSGVPSEITDAVVSVMCRLIFDFSLWARRNGGGSSAVPVLLVCEEAHRYVPGDRSAGFGPTRKAISQIAKEGRKYGVSLCLVSQRPSELSTSILSQCNTIFALRMTNDRDQEFIRTALPGSAMGLLSALPSLRPQEAVAVGEGVTVPMRLRFDELDEASRPRSGTARFSDAWKQDHPREPLIAETIDRWRRQMRTD